MDFKDFFAGQNDEGRRIDKIIRIFVPEMQLSQIYKALRKGLIKVNGKKVQQDYHVIKDDKISIAAFFLESKTSDKTEISAKKETIPLPQIVFQNEHLLILNKPSNINVHGKDSLEKIVCEFYNATTSKEDLAFKPGPLHRLDKMTTGLLAFSWSIKGAHWFSQNIKDHTISKKYLGIVQGELKTKAEWKDSIDKNESEGSDSSFHTVKINTDTENSKEAWTTVTPVKTGTYKNKKITLVLFDIHTGRQHQIRAQSSFHGFPLIGDTAYKGDNFNNTVKTFFLHAYELTFPKDNPLDLPETLKADLPLTFLDFLSKTCDINKIEL